MNKKMAIGFFNYLHNLENELKGNLFSYEYVKLVEAIRHRFISNYQNKMMLNCHIG